MQTFRWQTIASFFAADTGINNWGWSLSGTRARAMPERRPSTISFKSFVCISSIEKLPWSERYSGFFFSKKGTEAQKKIWRIRINIWHIRILYVSEICLRKNIWHIRILYASEVFIVYTNRQAIVFLMLTWIVLIPDLPTRNTSLLTLGTLEDRFQTIRILPT